AGNFGVATAIAAQFSQPPDYVLRSNIDSSFSGAKVNMFSPTSPIGASAGMTLVGSNATMASGTNWGEEVYSIESLAGSAYTSATVTSVGGGKGFALGLSTLPLADANYTSIDFAIYADPTSSSLRAYESGTLAATLGTYAAG